MWAALTIVVFSAACYLADTLPKERAAESKFWFKMDFPAWGRFL